MKIGCVKEIKIEEYRVGITPDNALEYLRHGHEVFIESGAGAGSGFSDVEYINAGCVLCENAEEIWDVCEMIIKVKEPIEPEFRLMKKGQIIYTFLHLAAEQELTYAMLESGCKGVAYETITDKNGLPCLKPMSEIAGRLATLEGAKYMEKPFGGRGILMGGVPGVRNARVLILGAGSVGSNALKMAIGLGADVTIADIDIARLTYLDDIYGNRIKTLYSTPTAINKELAEADLVIGAVLIPGASTPRLVKRESLKIMKPGTIIVDVAVDQGGCFETTRRTYHNDPVYSVEGIVHYCVGNMPGAVPVTSTVALTNATLRYGLSIANNGLEKACTLDKGLLNGLNIYEGICTNENVARCYNLPFERLEF